MAAQSALKNLADLSNRLHGQKYDGLLVALAENIRYLSGYSADDAWLLINHKGQAVLITDGRFLEQAASDLPPQVSVAEYKPTQKTLAATIVGQARLLNITNLAYEEEVLSAAFIRRLGEAAGDLALTPAGNLVEELRLIKSADETENIRRACQISCKAFKRFLECLRRNNNEKEMDYLLLGELLACGAEGLAFPTIIASGVNSSLCHAVPGERRLQKGDLLLCDFGARYRGYCADMTRTVVFGKADELQKVRYNIVLEAQLGALNQIKAGVSCQKVDQAARTVFKKYRLEDYFVHGLGHGVGLQTHEAPRLSPSSCATLQAGMVVTVEPGLYFPGWGGIRIEDTVKVTDSGCEILTDFSKKLLEL